MATVRVELRVSYEDDIHTAEVYVIHDAEKHSTELLAREVEITANNLAVRSVNALKDRRA